MSLFQALHTAGSSLRVQRIWMDAISDNIANLNTVRPFDEVPFRARLVLARSVDGTGASPLDPSGAVGEGAAVTGIAYGGDPRGRLVFDPSHPYANEQGLVRTPDIELGEQMVQLLAAQRSYQANLAVVERARDAYSAALSIGR